MSVNDLPDVFEQWARGPNATRHGARVCRMAIRKVMREAWHPVSEPPTEADGDHKDDVLVSVMDPESGQRDVFTNETPVVQAWAREGCDPQLRIEWARIRDVVLMPSQGGE